MNSHSSVVDNGRMVVCWYEVCIIVLILDMIGMRHQFVCLPNYWIVPESWVCGETSEILSVSVVGSQCMLGGGWPVQSCLVWPQTDGVTSDAGQWRLRHRVSVRRSETVRWYTDIRLSDTLTPQCDIQTDTHAPIMWPVLCSGNIKVILVKIWIGRTEQN